MNERMLQSLQEYLKNVVSAKVGGILSGWKSSELENVVFVRRVIRFGWSSN